MADVMKYIIDTSAILSQKTDELYRRTIYTSLWNRIDEMVQKHIIVTCSEIALEVQDDEIKEWMTKNDMYILPIDNEVQDNVRELVTGVNKALVDFKTCKSSGDAFLIATAKKYGLTVITEESVESPKKIPFTCRKWGIKCIGILQFMEEIGMKL